MTLPGSHPDWPVTHIGRSTVQDYIGEGEPTVPEKCKSEAPLPCPFCAEELDLASDGWEHPASDSCPLDSLFILHRHVDGWNRRVAEEDTALNPMTDPRADGPFVPVSLDDLGTCRKCGAEMSEGIAISQTYTSSPDYLGGDIVTLSPGGPGQVVSCRKCPQCGWSVTGAAPQEAEPVAWRYRAAPGGKWIVEPRRPGPARCHGNPQPLYAHPAPAPAVPAEGGDFDTRGQAVRQKSARVTPGLYLAHWVSGGTSEVAIGMTANGDNWIAPTNWLRPAMIRDMEVNGAWGEISRLEPIAARRAQQTAPQVKALVEDLQSALPDYIEWMRLFRTGSCRSRRDYATVAAGITERILSALSGEAQG